MKIIEEEVEIFFFVQVVFFFTLISDENWVQFQNIRQFLRQIKGNRFYMSRHFLFSKCFFLIVFFCNFLN